MSVTAILAMVAVFVWAGKDTEQCSDAAFAVCADPQRSILAILPSAILLVGGIGAFVQTYRAWRAGNAWPVWQGAGWFLFVFMTIYLAITSQALLAR